MALAAEFNKQLLSAVAKEVGLSKAQLNLITRYFPSKDKAFKVVTTNVDKSKRRLVQKDINAATKALVPSKVANFVRTLLRSVSNDEVTGFASVCVLGSKYQLSGPKPKEYVLTGHYVTRDRTRISIPISKSSSTSTHLTPEVPHGAPAPQMPSLPRMPGRRTPIPTVPQDIYHMKQQLPNPPYWLENLLMVMPFLLL